MMEFFLLFSPKSFSSRFISTKPRIDRCVSLIFPVVLCGYENRPLTLKDDHRLTVFKKRILRRIFGQKEEDR
jgi:hypothetical protein